ncbi:MAG TPA: 3-deoxy-D-manno-octulosonate 8-phosphate phosphatase, partial [Arenibacter sp.]|nr:3-deoxy-D-manno-octulosonate 8-phosphate phosphatase [Arenibacter sp.]
MDKSYKELLQDITTFVFDVDGVFTDGKILITSDGEMLRTMNVQDGYAVKVAIQQGYNICIISGGTNEGVRLRLRGLGVTDIHMGAHHKIDPFDEYLDIYNINPQHVLY